MTDTEVKQKGLRALFEALGKLDAERFITLLIRDPFDYTTWQKNPFGNLNTEEISSKAMSIRKKNS
jgi:hypothetical protein